MDLQKEQYVEERKYYKERCGNVVSQNKRVYVIPNLHVVNNSFFSALKKVRLLYPGKVEAFFDDVEHGNLSIFKALL